MHVASLPGLTSELAHVLPVVTIAFFVRSHSWSASGSYAIGFVSSSCTATAVQLAGATKLRQSAVSPATRQSLSEYCGDTHSNIGNTNACCCVLSGSCMSMHENGCAVLATTHVLSDPSHA